MQEKISGYFKRHIEVFRTVEETLIDDVQKCAAMMLESLRSGGKILVMGNGGSAADAQHFSAELVGRFLKNRQAIPSISLTTDSSILTAVGNDFGFDEIFSRQVEALATENDLLLGISTSGNSENVVRAMRQGKKVGCKTIGLLGKNGGSLVNEVDLSIIVKTVETPLIQDVHGAIIHILCGLIEDEICP